jgi:ATP-dependent HslUV protease subunit HslV
MSAWDALERTKNVGQLPSVVQDSTIEAIVVHKNWIPAFAGMTWQDDPEKLMGYNIEWKKIMKTRSTTILTVRKGNLVAMGGDGQVTLGQVALKHDAVKIRKLAEGNVLCGFAGSAADSLSLVERFESRLTESKSNIRRAAIALARDWRTDRILRKFEALLAVVDVKTGLIISGSGDVIEPTDGIIGIGSGGSYAVAAARALLNHSSLDAKAIVQASLEIAADLCVYTNRNITIETLEIKE